MNPITILWQICRLYALETLPRVQPKGGGVTGVVIEEDVEGQGLRVHWGVMQAAKEGLPGRPVIHWHHREDLQDA